MTQTGAEQFEFKAEVRKLLNIITHSLYSNREIFLRELVSNASDALDKLRYELNRNVEPVDAELPLEIRIEIDKDAKKLVITDTGVGMTHDELAANLGTIAKSGSEEFLDNLAKTAEESRKTDADTSADENAPDAASIIGRFGVGFYSVFMVAETVQVVSRSFQPGQHAYRWTSDGLGAFTIEPLDDADAATVQRGTRVEIFLKDDAVEYLDKHRVEDALKRHSGFIRFDILLDGEKVNTTPALWREPKFQITEEQYADFYKHISYDTKPPLSTLHVSVDAPVQFTSLAFIPEQGRDLYGLSQGRYGLDLYNRRVLIAKEFKDFLPEYLGFLTGLVDTEDLPLNISRETLQENALIRKIQSTLTKQTLTHLGKLAKDDPEKYSTFWRAHGSVFKHGYADYANQEKFAPLLRFNASGLPDKDALISLDEYIERSKEGQEAIYFIAGTSRESIAMSPLMEMFDRKGIEALYLYEPIDEFVLETLGSYKDKPLVAAEKVKPEDLDRFENATEVEEAPELSDTDRSTMDALVARVKEILGERVTEVRLSKRLTTSPALLVSPDDGMSSHMQKIMQIINKDAEPPQKAMELNPDHPLLRNLLGVYKKNPSDAYLTQSVEQLFESCLLMDGYLTDPHAMVERMNKLLEQSSGWYLQVHND